MADDEIERLLREVQAQTSGQSSGQSSGQTSGQGQTSASSPVRRGDAQPPAGRSAGSRLAFAIGTAAVFGAGTWLLGLLMPFVSAVSAGIGGAVAGGLVALLLGPPRWFSS